MKNQDGVPLSDNTEHINEKQQNESKKRDKRKRKQRNHWPIKAMIITLFLAFAVNAASEIVLEDTSKLVLPVILTAVILVVGVLFDVIGTASTSCEIEPFLSMASRKVKGSKTAVKLAQNSDVVSSVCNDIVGDICGIVSGVCAATIANIAFGGGNFWLSVLIYALVSTATITLKALGKSYAVNNANDVIFSVAKILSIFSKEG